ncbi:MAG: sensor histidine kinase, partial [Bulleidia sp.]
VSDDGIGMDPDTLQNLNDRIAGKQDNIVRPLKSHGNGIALENVNKRIGILFGQNYGMHVFSTPGSGTDVEIFLPKISNPAEKNGI